MCFIFKHLCLPPQEASWRHLLSILELDVLAVFAVKKDVLKHLGPGSIVDNHCVAPPVLQLSTMDQKYCKDRRWEAQVKSIKSYWKYALKWTQLITIASWILAGHAEIWEYKFVNTHATYTMTVTDNSGTGVTYQAWVGGILNDKTGKTLPSFQVSDGMWLCVSPRSEECITFLSFLVCIYIYICYYVYV